MFRPFFREIDDDPVFGNQMQRMERLMDGLMPSFDDMYMSPPFGGFPALMGPQLVRDGRRGSRFRSNALMPFGFSDPGFLFSGLERLSNDPNCHSFSSSSVMTYSMGDNGQPTVYQASSSTRTAPGGMQETTKTVSDTSTGEHKMSFGRHLGDRAHIMEKSQNRYTGDVDESEEFLNMEDADVQNFNNEWKQRTAPVASRSSNQISTHPYQRPALAIADGSSNERHSHKLGKKNTRKGVDKGHHSKKK